MSSVTAVASASSVSPVSSMPAEPAVPVAHTPPSEVLVRAPRPDTVPSMQQLVAQLAPVMAPVRVRLVTGDGAGDPQPLPSAALITGAQAGVEQLLRRGEGWRWVHLLSSGGDHFRALPALPEETLCTYARGVNAQSVAEWVLGALLHFARDFDRYGADHASVRNGGPVVWRRHWARELRGQHVVIEGAGHAGRALAAMLRPLGVRVTAVGRGASVVDVSAVTGVTDVMNVLTVPHGATVDGVFDSVVGMSDLPRLLPEADAVVVLLPLSPETQGCFGAEMLRLLRPDAVLVVASRGGIVSEAAVAERLEAGLLRGAAFDVYAEEPLSGASPLWRAPNVLLTPHVAGTTDQFAERSAEVIARIWHAVFVAGMPNDVAECVWQPAVSRRAGLL